MNEGAETMSEAERQKTPEEEVPEAEAEKAEAEPETAPAAENEDAGEKKHGAKKKKDKEPKHAETDALKAELAQEHDKYLRLYAEFDNYRKRSQKEREGLYADVKAETVKALLPVYDNLERALRQGTEDTAFYQGVEMTMKQLTEIFTKLGVTPIEAVGQPFDPARHNAVMHVEDENLGENTVAEEFQKGFTLGDKVIRFSLVKVAN